jgi:isoleucyl-tRNA synthetase
VATEAGYTIALDTTLDEDLLAEGLAREFVNRVQNMRKSANLEVTDHIRIAYQASPHMQKALQKLAAYVKSETLAKAIVSLDSAKNHLTHREEWEVGAEKVTISIAQE